MSEDPLNKETSVSIELTDAGFKAGAKSRTIAGLDRLCGNIVEAVNIPLERRNQRARTVMEGEKMLAEAAVNYAIQKMDADPDFAGRVLANHFDGLSRAQRNKDAVASEAIEQLKMVPPTESESTSGPDVLDEGFMVRFEQYAGEASTGELRAKWARVLASEIRKPGTFSGKTLRIIDEMEPETAQLFEGLAQHRLGGVVPICLSGELNYLTKLLLVGAGLLAEPGPSAQVKTFGEITSRGGEVMWETHLGPNYLAFQKARGPNKRTLREDVPIFFGNAGEPMMPVYVLTEVGVAIASILEDRQASAFNKYIEKAAEFLAPTAVIELIEKAPGRLEHVRTIQKQPTA